MCVSGTAFDGGRLFPPHDSRLPACRFAATLLHLTPPLLHAPSLMQDGKHGKAWGTLTWRGRPQRPDAPPTQLSGPLKPLWRALAAGEQQQQPWDSLVAAALRQEQQAAAAGSEAEAAEPAEPVEQQQQQAAG